MRHPVRILSVLILWPSQSHRRDPSHPCTGLLCVEPGGQRAEPSSFCELVGPLDHGGVPHLLGSLFVRDHSVSWGLLLSQFGKMSPAFMVPSTLMSVH